jgi:6-phosphogluconolactonase (cycloisomerase 2 family)
MASSLIGSTDEPSSLAFDPAGPYLYVGNNDVNNSGDIAAFSPSAGVLGSQLTGSTYLAGSVPSSLAVDVTDGVVFDVNDFDDTIGVYSIGTGGSAGQLTAVANSVFVPGTTGLADPYAVASYPAGGFVYITDMLAVGAGTAPGKVFAYTWSAAAGGSLTLIASYTVGIDPKAVTIDPTGQYLYVSNGNDATVSGFTINASTGALTAMAGSPFPTGAIILPSVIPTGLAVDPSGEFLFLANGEDSTITVFSIAQNTGVLAAVTQTLGTTGTTVPATNGGGDGTSAIAIQ